MKKTTNQKQHFDSGLIVITVCIFLAAIVFVTFGRALHYGFVEYDDPDYVYQNARIIGGLSLGSIWWAFTHIHADNWHPLTTISHMLDCQIYGLQPWGHHLTNILLQATTAVLLFLALRRLTQSLWPSAFVAALFAIHPLRVESVVWISERKDVLSGVFFMLTLLSYGLYARSQAHRTRNYLFVHLWFVLGLLCKPTLVTLPFVLLLLDYWPLKRWPESSQRQGSKAGSQWSVIRRLLTEKLLLFAFSAASCVGTVIAQRRVLETSIQTTLLERADNAFISYLAHLREMFWPLHLSISHPYVERYQNLPQAVASLLLLLVISVLCFRLRRNYPFLITGWLWYLGVLIPMIGIVQVSAQSRADRYTYLSQIGVYIMLSWGALTISKKWRLHPAALTASALFLILACAVRSYGQATYWQDTEALWRHAIEVSPSDYIAHDSLGSTVIQKGRVDEAIAEYEKAIAIKPNYAQSYNNLGNALMQNGQPGLAVEQYQKALALDAHDAQAHNNLGTLLLKQGHLDEAIEHYRAAVAADPESAELDYNLGSALIMKGDWAGAINQLEAALKIDNDYPEAHNKLGIALGAAGRMDDAINQFKEALRLHHIYPQAHFNLGSILVHVGQRQEGIAHLLEAVRLKPDYTEAKEELRELGVAPP